MISRTRFGWTLVLMVAAALSGYAAWQLRDDGDAPPLVGPPRSDYFVDRFELIAFDAAGAESFALRGPRLSRHPQLGTIDIEQPRLRLPGEGQGWQGRADRGWISEDGERVRLSGRVDLRGPAARGDSPLRLRSSEIELRPQEQVALSDQAVTVSGAGTILRGRGLRADLTTRRVEFFAEVTGRYDPPRTP